ncbi:hypothetical protein Syun_021333 [Stephania yunnanensis]|uniref:CCHC-type domain-containing protein n=1 Tax=Stephania yunnanensis TaxID=152371 RepID=A0AAP0NS68_9MAGN
MQLKVATLHLDKPLEEYTAEEIKIELSNDQAMNHLFCALSENEFNRVSACQTAKEVWEKLGVHYEGTMQVKKTKLRILEEHYETFRVGSDEDIATAITRFTKLLNEIKNLGKNYDQETSVYKFLRGLPKEWDAKKYAIQSAQNLGDYTFDALCGELTVHEFELKDRARLEALSGGTKSSRKDIALKANSSPSASVEIIENEKSCDDNDLEEEVAMLSRKLNRAMYKRDKYKKKFRSGSKGGNSNETICFGCGKPGHIKADCKSKKVFDNKKGKKSFKETWDDSSSSSSESESESEKAILCLMAQGEVNSNFFNFDNVDDLDDVPNLDELRKELEKEVKKTKQLKKSLTIAISEIESQNETINDLQSDLNEVIEERDALVKEVEDLTSTVHKFTNGKEMFDMMLGAQRRALNNKRGIGYGANLLSYKKLLNDDRRCSKCNKTHVVGKCALQKAKVGRLAWVVKNVYYTNILGPKGVWVPKSSVFPIV